MGTITRSFANLITASGPSSVPALETLTVDNIQFPATQVASADANTLDDYEEGTFTPAFTSTGASFSYQFQIGHYTKIGRSVQCNLIIRGQSSGTLSNEITITGFPFTSANTTGNFSSTTFGQINSVDYPTSSNFLTGVMDPNQSKITLQVSNDDSTATNLTAISVDGLTSSGFIIGINYFV
jgi:hypothetical protein